MMLDVFKDDAFHMINLTAAISKVPYAPTRIGRLGWFREEGINTLTAAIEMDNGVLTLVPTAPRGAPGAVKGLERRNVRDFRTVHLPQRIAVTADEAMGLRAFGSETEVETAMGLLQRKMVPVRRDLDLTHEYQRVGAIKGLVLDADGSTIYNWHTEFNVSATTANLALSVAGTKVLQEVIGFKGTIEDKLGMAMSSGYRALCGSTFFKNFTSHSAVVEAFKFGQNAFLRTDNRSGFEFGGVVWEEYRGSVGGSALIPATKAYLVPEGVADMFMTYFSPAPYMETAGTTGLPFYMKAKNMDYDIGVEWNVQSNPLHICTRPDAILEITAT